MHLAKKRFQIVLFNFDFVWKVYLTIRPSSAFKPLFNYSFEKETPPSHFDQNLNGIDPRDAANADNCTSVILFNRFLTYLLLTSEPNLPTYCKLWPNQSMAPIRKNSSEGHRRFINGTHLGKWAGNYLQGKGLQRCTTWMSALIHRFQVDWFNAQRVIHTMCIWCLNLRKQLQSGKLDKLLSY